VQQQQGGALSRCQTYSCVAHTCTWRRPSAMDAASPLRSRRALQAATAAGDLAAGAGSASAGAQDSEGGGALTLIIFLVVLFGSLLAWRLWRITRWWADRARSAKVLDEIEMEFVNDDMEHEVEVLEDVTCSRSGFTSTWGGAR